MWRSHMWHFQDLVIRMDGMVLAVYMRRRNEGIGLSNKSAAMGSALCHFPFPRRAQGDPPMRDPHPV